jgi:hypothetical protein
VPSEAKALVASWGEAEQASARPANAAPKAATATHVEKLLFILKSPFLRFVRVGTTRSMRPRHRASQAKLYEKQAISLFFAPLLY